jgi:hypothetical protein
MSCDQIPPGLRVVVNFFFNTYVGDADDLCKKKHFEANAFIS